MWPFKTKIIHCSHDFSKRLGFFYKETLSEDPNGFDRISVYVRYECTKCGERKNEFLGADEYVPELYQKRDPKKDEFIKELISFGCVPECGIMMLDYGIKWRYD